MNSKNGKKILGGAALVCILSVSLLLLGQDDALLVWKWWALCIVMGMGTLPLAHRLLSPLADGGYFASKVLGIALCGLVTWLLCSAGVPFSALTCVIVTLVIFCICWGAAYALGKRKGGTRAHAKRDIPCTVIAVEELLFLALLVMWLYLIGFRPAAYGTEKLMDYGFMASMMRSTSLPATDMWYSDGTINYYYGGQYYVVFMTKLFFTELKNAYNLFRAFIAAVTFVMAFTIVFTMLKRAVCEREGKKKPVIPYIGGCLAGAALTFAGNGHYIVFARIVPMLQEILGLEADVYWFSDSTRYIGYQPDVADKTIHEYPSYSFLLGDLHAHVINLMLVLLFVSILLAWCLRSTQTQGQDSHAKKKNGWLMEIVQPEIVALSVLAGIYRWTNFWDFAIYFGAAGLIILAVNMKKYAGRYGEGILITAAQALMALAVSSLVILPFTLHFDTMYQGFALAKNHSRFYQLVILWGIPTAVILVFAVSVYRKARGAAQESAGAAFGWMKLPMEDLFAVIMGLYAVILVILPEVVYVRDIYEQGHARANTMFKFTYQAFVLFAMLMSYAIVRMIASWKAGTGVRRFGMVMLALLVWTCGYFPTAVRLWLGDVTDTSGYQGSDATAFLETDFAQDAAAIDWLMEHVEGSPVVLEADGESYSSYCVVSAVTGLPTVMGWYTHEWLWRNDPSDLNQRAADVLAIYTSDSADEVRALIEKYRISYIFVGSNEYSKYGTVNTALFEQLGTLVFEGESTDTAQPTRIYQIN